MFLSWLQTQEQMRKFFMGLKQEEKMESLLKQEGKMAETSAQLSVQDSCRYFDTAYSD